MYRYRWTVKVPCNKACSLLGMLSLLHKQLLRTHCSIPPHMAVIMWSNYSVVTAVQIGETKLATVGWSIDAFTFAYASFIDQLADCISLTTEGLVLPCL